jgi:hypothetical protein
LNLVRWIVVLPAAAVCGYVAYLLGGTINNLFFAWYLGPPSEGWPKLASDFMAHMYMGAAFSYSAVRIAPSGPRYVAVTAFALLLAGAGLSIWSSFAIGKFYALPANAGLLFGGVAVLVGTFAGEVVPYNKSRRSSAPS